MLTGVVKSAFRASDAHGYEPLAVVDRLWNNMTAFGPEKFVTLIAAVLSLEEGRLRYVNAGHPAALLQRQEPGLVRLASTGPLVSPAFRTCQWEEQSVSVGAGDVLLLYTDGVADALAREDDSGEEALLAAMHQYAGGGAPLLESILTRARERFGGRPQPDDWTLLTATVLRSR
jgi:sigma-B regulation protein RsbU (phosphoserine phosphatase)